MYWNQTYSYFASFSYSVTETASPTHLKWQGYATKGRGEWREGERNVGSGNATDSLWLSIVGFFLLKERLVFLVAFVFLMNVLAWFILQALASIFGSNSLDGRLVFSSNISKAALKTPQGEKKTFVLQLQLLTSHYREEASNMMMF